MENATNNAAAGASPVEPADPMDWPLPCDVTVGHGTMKKGVKLRALVTRMKVLYEMATNQNADEVAGRSLEQRKAMSITQPSQALEGFCLVPIRATRAMEEVFEEEGWEWANVLAAAEAVTLEEYEQALEGAQPSQAGEPVCWCTTCRPITVTDMRFVVCPDCGNKRCPKAHNHKLACTGSNDVGQPGSSWEHVQKQPSQALEPEFFATSVPGNQHDTGRVTYKNGGFFASTCSLEDARRIAEAMNNAKQPSQAGELSDKTWCGYVAGIIGTYLGEPVEGKKVQAIAGIIERRLWALPPAKEAS